MLPVVRILQRAWPATRFTWVIGRVEARLMQLVPDIEFIAVDRHGGTGELLRLRHLLAGRRFDLLLHMQLAARASLLSLLVRAPVKLGFDRRRARELQWLFTTHSIATRRREHVLDAMLGFTAALGVPDRELRWDIPLPDEALDHASRLIPDDRPTLVISPCSSHRLRTWSAAGYAAHTLRAKRIALGRFMRWRHRRRHPEEPDGGASLERGSVEPPQPRALAHKEALSRLDRALGEIEVGRRAVVVLHEIEEMTAPEIARALDIPLNTVYSRLRVGREELTRALREQGGAT